MAEDQTKPVKKTQPAPFFQSMQREMNQFIDKFRGHPMSSPGDFFEALGAPAFPAIDVVETDDALEITAEIPGVDEDDLDISIANNALVLKGEKSSEHEDKEQDFHLVERRYGSFRRQLPLGFTPEGGAVNATFKNGVLKLKIAKPEGSSEPVQKIKISKS
jgi:HSP20 family protein